MMPLTYNDRQKINMDCLHRYGGTFHSKRTDKRNSNLIKKGEIGHDKFKFTLLFLEIVQ